MINRSKRGLDLLIQNFKIFFHHLFDGDCCLFAYCLVGCVSCKLSGSSEFAFLLDDNLYSCHTFGIGLCSVGLAVNFEGYFLLGNCFSFGVLKGEANFLGSFDLEGLFGKGSFGSLLVHSHFHRFE